MSVVAATALVFKGYNRGVLGNVSSTPVSIKMTKISADGVVTNSTEQGWVGDRIVRTRGVLSGTAFGLQSGAVVAGNVNRNMFIGARVIAGLRIGFINAIVPPGSVSYHRPTADAPASQSSSWPKYLGAVIAYWINFGMPSTNDEIRWRFRLGNDLINIFLAGRYSENLNLGRRAGMGFLLPWIQQWTGILAIAGWSTTLFQVAGFSSYNYIKSLLVSFVTWIYGTEIWPRKIRPKVYSFTIFGWPAGCCMTQFVIPIILNRLGWGTFAFFGAMNAVALPIVYLFYPDMSPGCLRSTQPLGNPLTPLHALPKSQSEQRAMPAESSAHGRPAEDARDMDPFYLEHLVPRFGHDAGAMANFKRRHREAELAHGKKKRPEDKQTRKIKRKRADSSPEPSQSEDDGDGEQVEALVRKHVSSKRRAFPSTAAQTQRIVDLIRTDFPMVPAHYVGELATEHDYSLFSAYLDLDHMVSTWHEHPLKSWNLQFAPQDVPRPDPDLPINEATLEVYTLPLDDAIAALLRGINEARTICLLRRLYKARSATPTQDTQPAIDTGIEDDMQLKDGETFQCECCFDEFAIASMVHCNGEVVHCQGGFDESQRRLFLDENLTKVLGRIEWSASLLAAGIADLATCPFCDYAAEYPPVDEATVFQCEAPNCRKRSCRICNKDDHQPERCEAEYTNADLAARRKIEEARTQALIRKCNKCRTPFIKDTGCNRMHCTKCGNQQCYLCSASLRDYSHFGHGSSQCILWDENVQGRHDAAVEAAEIKACARVLAETKGSISEDKLKINMAKAVQDDDERRRIRTQRLFVHDPFLIGSSGNSINKIKHQHQHRRRPKWTWATNLRGGSSNNTFRGDSNSRCKRSFCGISSLFLRSGNCNSSKIETGTDNNDRNCNSSKLGLFSCLPLLSGFNQSRKETRNAAHWRNSKDTGLQARRSSQIPDSHKDLTDKRPRRKMPASEIICTVWRVRLRDALGGHEGSLLGASGNWRLGNLMKRM
ncbi:sugar transport STP1 [Emericellopsis cladophorae]|uniref:Sugar transport STP1 n=1 Tax=Emericellopsis cladophorae TaxID=2686198 RepID=A0A9P9XVB7_9HYPO|nr:sugar transport STP1 [Emericellopsis cladophorae]KAI6778497.1 sugar transport STP1 [Emericellopsis cladophorae]